jgi:copper homeostasis protein
VSDPISIEICVDSVASSMAADQGGANCVELCANLPEGGVTASAGLMELVRDRISIDLQIMIRPRAGSFFYTDDEFEVMRRDILFARKTGVDGVVLGILTADGEVDVERTTQLVELARPLNVTFHRAFDVSANIFQALEDVCACGADRVLTSGGKRTAFDGIDTIARLVQAARGRIAIMAGGGIREHNTATIVEQTGVKEIHSSLGPSTDSHTDLHTEYAANVLMALGHSGFEVRHEDVRKLREAVEPARGSNR